MNLQDAQIYIGTYSKYNAGSLAGAWLKIIDFNSKDDFIEAALELHADEEDPELMFQDIQNIPDYFAGESWISEKIWDILDVCDDAEQANIFIAWVEHLGMSGDICDLFRDFENSFVGKFDSDEDFAYDYATMNGDLINTWPYDCIDWKHAARELMYDYFVIDGNYFHYV